MGKIQEFYKDKLKEYPILIYTLLCVICIIMICCKRNYHVDETYTFGLSNYHNNSISISLEDGKRYIPSDTPYMDYMAVQPDGRFDYKNVWINQEHDVHPPLYYALVHSICSFFPGKVSVWFPGTVNIVFMMLTFYVFRKLLRYVCNDDTGLLYASLFFIFSAGMLSIVTFMRMYVMTMFFVTWITYLLIQVADEQLISMKKGICIFAVTVIGALTHYYFIVYVVFLCISTGMYLLIKKQWKSFFQLLSIMICSASIAIIIFPSMITHMFLGYRGEESIKNLQNDSILEYWEHLKKYYSFLNDDLMGGLLGYILVIVAILLLTKGYLTRENNNSISENTLCIRRCLIIGVSILLYYFTVAKIAVYQTDRYISPVYAVTIAVIMTLVSMLIKGYRTEKCNKMIIMSIILAIAIVMSWKSCKWEYLYTYSSGLLDKLSSYEDRDCIYVYNNPWRVQSNYLEIQKLNSVTFYKDDHYTDMFKSDVLNQDEIIVYIVNSCNVDSILKDIVARARYINKYEQLGSFGYANSYRLYSENVEIQNMDLCSYNEEQELIADVKTKNALVSKKTDEKMLEIVKKPGSDFVTIYKDNLALDNDHNIYKPGNNIQFFTPNNSEAQHWRIVQNQDGTVCLVALNNEYALTRTIEGNVILDNYNQDNENQKWWLK